MSGWSVTPLLFVGFFILGVSASIFAWRVFHVARSGPLVVIGGVFLVLVGFACFGLSLLSPCALSGHF
jgi:hypothetical protein